jgi:hypothetical protein
LNFKNNELTMEHKQIKKKLPSKDLDLPMGSGSGDIFTNELSPNIVGRAQQLQAEGGIIDSPIVPR